MRVTGVKVSLKTRNDSVTLNGTFEVTSTTRQRYGTQATSLTLSEVNNMVDVEMDTEELLRAMVRGGLTADDFRHFADMIDAE